MSATSFPRHRAQKAGGNPMKLIYAIAAAAALSGCENWTDEQTNAAVDLAVQQIEAYNAAGIDPVTLDETERMYLASVCLGAQIANPMMATRIVKYCELLQAAAQ
jgi:hypothetical protein